ncbi:hypothetical protein KCP73_25665 [Salmonella enterica subsp. enterica]|nr:hypothetical protein KCP73_25665 [Salmonella enterica subsp. enterica]
MYRAEKAVRRRNHIEGMSWNYKRPDGAFRKSGEENNGFAAAWKVSGRQRYTAREGQLMRRFCVLRDDGTTSSSCWFIPVLAGRTGQQMSERDSTSTRRGLA